MNDPREELIAICEAAVVPPSLWADRDSAGAQRQIGEAWALLRAGCEFTISRDGDLATNDRTIWVDIRFPGFRTFEYGMDDYGLEVAHFYLPTRARLAERPGKDWY